MYKKQLMFFTSVLMLFSAFFFGCNQDKFDAGIDLVPDSLRIKSSATDTFSVEAYTYRVDTLLTSNTSKVLVGAYSDPILGQINASFVTEMLPSSSNIDSLVKDGTSIDSLVLYLRYPLSGLRVYGDSTVPIRLNVMRVNKYLTYSEAYYSNFNSVELNATAITDITFTPEQIIDNADKEAERKYWEMIEEELADTVGGKQPDTASIERPDPVHVLSIKLPNELKEEVTDLVINSINGTTTFTQEFNGLYITANTDPSPSSVSIFDYTDAETKVALHYHTATDTSETPLEYVLNLGSSSTHFNLFEHNYNAPGFLPDLVNPENNQDSVVYLHGTAGLKAKIKFTDIDELIQQGLWAVNKAELIFQVENVNDENSYYPFPNNLILKRIADKDEEDDEYYLTEYLTYNQNTGASTYNGATYSDGEYKFDITLYMQRVFKGEHSNNGLFLSIPDQAVNPSRVVLTSGNHSNRMKLKLTLTKLFN